MLVFFAIAIVIITKNPEKCDSQGFSVAICFFAVLSSKKLMYSNYCYNQLDHNQYNNEH
jgi:hypothetical protein